jgi:hypothetical protein
MGISTTSIRAVRPLAAALALAFAGYCIPAHAVHVNPAGSGQVLLFPYYTVRGFSREPLDYFDTLISITNSGNRPKAVKVRLHEGMAGSEALTFNLFLGANDVWTGAITRTSEGAALVSTDTSCTVPNDIFAKRADINTADPNHLTNANYRTRGDGGPVTWDRTREGYVEVLEMGEVIRPDWQSWIGRSPASLSGVGRPLNCAGISEIDGQMSAGLAPPTGGLFGKLDLINVAQGVDFSFDAVALDDWAATEQYTAAASLLPTLAGGGGAARQPSNTRSSHVFGGQSYRFEWADNPGAALPSQAADAVSAALLRYSLMGEFNGLTETDSSTDWIITMPTKRLYVGVGSGAARRPFASNYNGTNCANRSGAPDVYDFDLYNREEQERYTAIVILPGVSLPNPPPRSVACYVTNHFAITDAAMLETAISERRTNGTSTVFMGGLISYRDVSTGAPVRPTNRVGWLSVNFSQAVQFLPTRRALGSFEVVVLRGLPAIGIQLSDFNNRNAQPGRVARYGSSGYLKHRISIID